MNIFITPNNQKLLWQTISQSPLFSEKPQKEEWFRNIVGQFYESNKQNTMITLKDINITTIKFMINKLKEETTENKFQQTNISPSSTPSHTPYLRQDISNLRKNEFDEKLRSMENDHKTLLKKPLPPEIDFRDKVEDTPIANIGDLIKMEIEKRNREINEYSTKVMPQAISHISIKPTVSNIPNNDTLKKTVSWSSSTDNFSNLNTNDVDKSTEHYKQKIDTLNEEISLLKEQVSLLKEQFSNLKEQFSTYHIMHKLDHANKRAFSIEDTLTFSNNNPMWEYEMYENTASTPPSEPVSDNPSTPPSEPVSDPFFEEITENTPIPDKIESDNSSTESKQLSITIPEDSEVIEKIVPKAPRNKKNKKK